MWDTLFEFLRFICVAGIVSALWWAGRRYNLHLQKGWTLIFWGAVLVMGGSFLNLIDNVWGAAETVIGEFFEEVVGYVLGDLLIVIGFWRWLPVVGSLRKAERELEEANENLKVQVSERTFSLRDANTKLSQNMKQQALISHLGQMAISGENNLQELMDSAVRGVSEVLEVEYCKLLELLPDGKRLLLRAGVGWNPGLVGKATVGAGLDSQAGYTLMVSDPVIVKDLTRETRFSGPQLLHDHDVRSGISIAIGKKFHSYGVLGAHSKALRIFTKEQAEFIKSVALILTDAIHMDYLLNSLADNEERFRHLLETTSMIPWEADWERKQFSYVGKSASNILGYSIDAWQEEGFWADHIFSADRDHTVGLSRRLSENLEEFDIEYRMVSKSGEVVWIQDLVTVVQQQGSPAVLRGFMLNITDRKRAEEILKKSETRLRGIFDAAPDGVLMVRQDGRIAKSNGQIEVLFGYSPEDLVGQPLENLIPERFRKDHLQHIRSYFASPRTRPMGINMDLQALHKDGHEFPVEIGLSPFITDDEVFSIAGIRDIGWRKKAEADLEEKTQLLMQITDNIREILWIGSPDWETVVYVSPAYEEIWGRSSKSLYADGRSWMDGVHEEDREKVEGAVLRRVKGDFSETAFPEFRVVHPNGIIRWVTVRAYPVYDDQGKVFRVTGVAEDITNEVEARNRFKREHSETVRLKTLLEGVMQNMTTGLMVTDSSGGILLLNRIGGEILGISPGDVEGSPLVGVSPELENFEKSSSQKGAIREFVFKRSDGKAVPIGFSSSPLIREGSDPGGNITVFKDLTDQLDSEKKMREKEKFATIGEVAAGIAHEIKNPLFAISSGIQLLQNTMKIKEEKRKTFDIIFQETMRVDRLIQQLLNYSGKHQLRFSRVLLSDLIDEVISLNQGLLEEKSLKIKIKNTPNLPIALCDRDLIVQVLINLIQNAIEVSPKKRTLEVACGPGKEEGFLSVKVKDNGPGIPEDIRDKIFDPFYSTKKGNTGMGLAISKRIVSDHGGEIWVEPGKTGGAVFIFEIPFNPRSEKF